MKYSIVFHLLFFSFSILQAQINSEPYQGRSLIKIDLSDHELRDSLLKRKAFPIGCRVAVSSSDLVVDSITINWLKENGIPFSILQNDMSKIIDLEMKNIRQKKQKRDGNWYTVYRELDEIENHIDLIVTDSDISTKIVIGQSYEGRDIFLVKISADTTDLDKPAVFINGCQHAREWITPMAATYLIESLSSQYGSDEEITMLLNLVDVYILPVMNPDGYVYTWEEDRWWRKNRQINLGSECVGTDLNRNWDFDWNGLESTSQDPCSYIYVGASPFSAPETQVVSNYLLSIPNLVNHIDLHNYSALIVGPWASSNELTDDNDEIFCLGTKMQSVVSNENNYPYIFGTGTVNGLLYLISGGMVDWIYASLSSLSYLYELRPASLYYFNSEFDGLGAFDNDESDILSTCQEFYQGVIEMIKWASIQNCEFPVGCSDPLAENYYCNTLEGEMACLYIVNVNVPPQDNGAYNLLEYSLPLGFVDDGSCVYDNSINSYNTKSEIIKSIDFLGRDNNIKDGLYIDIYDDGSVQKRYTY